jgi:YesN/AraC family two-component response regulator
MACESCKLVVKEALEKIGANPVHVDLGIAEVEGKLSASEQKEFGSEIKKVGLELVKNREGILIDLVKSSIIQYIEEKDSKKVNLSDYLSKKLNYDYPYLSGYFSAMQAQTIEQFTIAYKIEKAKEMLVVDGLTLSEIADKLGYSSLAHLSAQFKKVSGLPASHFKKLNSLRKTLQEL